MLTLWNDINRLFDWRDFRNAFDRLDTWRREMDRLSETGATDVWSNRGTWPLTNLYDNGQTLVVAMEVPGLTSDQLDVTVHSEVLTVRGERKVDVPEGYSVHRRERAPIRFSRSFSLPHKIDPEKVAAEVKNGILTITMEKVPEAQPKQITVQAR